MKTISLPMLRRPLSVLVLCTVVGAVSGVAVDGGAVVGAGLTPGASGSPGWTVIVWVVVRAGGGSSLVSAMNAATITPRARAPRASRATIGRRQRGEGAITVRAGSPQLRHQSCWEWSHWPQRGQGITPGAGTISGASGVLMGPGQGVAEPAGPGCPAAAAGQAPAALVQAGQAQAACRRRRARAQVRRPAEADRRPASSPQVRRRRRPFAAP